MYRAKVQDEEEKTSMFVPSTPHRVYHTEYTTPATNTNENRTRKNLLGPFSAVRPPNRNNAGNRSKHSKQNTANGGKSAK